MFGGPDALLSFRVGSHVIETGNVLSSLIAFVVVLAAASFVVSRLLRREEQVEATQHTELP